MRRNVPLVTMWRGPLPVGWSISPLTFQFPGLPFSASRQILRFKDIFRSILNEFSRGLGCSFKTTP